MNEINSKYEKLDNLEKTEDNFHEDLHEDIENNIVKKLEKTKECIICYENTNNFITYYPCGHELCSQCFEKWNIVLGNRICYICRSTITPEYINILSVNQNLEIHNIDTRQLQNRSFITLNRQNYFQESFIWLIFFFLKTLFIFFILDFLIGQPLIFVLKYNNVDGAVYISISIQILLSFVFLLIYEFVKLNEQVRRRRLLYGINNSNILSIV